MKKNDTEIYTEGHNAGYNQHRVDSGEITQEEADTMLREAKENKNN